MTLQRGEFGSSGIRKYDGDEGHRGGSGGCRDDDRLGFLHKDNGRQWGH